MDQKGHHDGQTRGRDKTVRRRLGHDPVLAVPHLLACTTPSSMSSWPYHTFWHVIVPHLLACVPHLLACHRRTRPSSMSSWHHLVHCLDLPTVASPLPVCVCTTRTSLSIFALLFIHSIHDVCERDGVAGAFQCQVVCMDGIIKSPRFVMQVKLGVNDLQSYEVYIEACLVLSSCACMLQRGLGGLGGLGGLASKQEPQWPEAWRRRLGKGLGLGLGLGLGIGLGWPEAWRRLDISDMTIYGYIAARGGLKHGVAWIFDVSTQHVHTSEVAPSGELSIELQGIHTKALGDKIALRNPDFTPTNLSHALEVTCERWWW